MLGPAAQAPTSCLWRSLSARTEQKALPVSGLYGLRGRFPKRGLAQRHGLLSGAADERGVLLAVPLPYVALLGTAAIGTTLEDNAGDAQLTIARHNGLNASEATSAVK